MTGSGRRAWRLLGAFSLLLLCMCRSCWLPHRGTDRAIDDAEFVGTWELAEESLAYFVRDGYVRDPARTHTIEFREDGSATMHAADEVSDGGIEYVEGDGTWQTRKKDDDTLVTLTLASHMAAFTVDEDEYGLVLFAFYFDPDSWEFIEYRRRD